MRNYRHLGVIVILVSACEKNPTPPAASSSAPAATAASSANTPSALPTASVATPARWIGCNDTERSSTCLENSTAEMRIEDIKQMCAERNATLLDTGCPKTNLVGICKNDTLNYRTYFYSSGGMPLDEAMAKKACNGTGDPSHVHTRADGEWIPPSPH